MFRPATAIITACLTLAFALATEAQPRDEEGEERMLSRINVLRQAARLTPLQRDDGLDAAARTHSADMAWHQELTHVSERTGDPAARVEAAGFQAASVGQNIARATTSDAAHQSLVDSEPHLANMLNPDFTHVGLAAVTTEDDETIWVTQVFALGQGGDGGTSPDLPVPPVAYRGGNGRGASSPDRVEGAQAASQPPERGELSATGTVRRARPAGRASAAEPASPARTPGGPTVTVPGPQSGAGRAPAGYWVFHGQRWWYFPLPPDAQPGQQLEPDLTVVGPPPGYDVMLPPGTGAAGRPDETESHRQRRFRRHRRRPGSAPAFGWSPRRHYDRWLIGR